LEECLPEGDDFVSVCPPEADPYLAGKTAALLACHWQEPLCHLSKRRKYNI